MVLVSAAVLGSLAWLLGVALGFKLKRHLKRLVDWEPEGPADATLTVVVPARNEEHTLEAATTTLLAQDLPGLRVALVDDRSDDGTAALVDALAERDPRIEAHHVATLPEGWLGKTHAMSVGAAGATTDWLLFTDADVHFAPDALARAVAYAEAHSLDHLVLLPDLVAHGFGLQCAIAAFGRQFALSQRLWAVSDPASSASAGVGAFNLVRREFFERTEGFEWFRMDVVDDVALGKLMKSAGARCDVLMGRDLVSVHWYETLSDMVRGLEKNTYAALGCRLHKVILAVTMMLLFDSAPWIALHGLGVPGLPWLGALALAAGMGTGVILSRWARQPLVPALLYPIGTLLVGFIMLRAGVLGAAKGGISWRDTFYSSKQLRKNARVRFL